MAISTASSFKSKSTATLELPSGESVLCRRGGIEVFLRSGKVPNSLMPIMKAALGGNDKVKKAAQDVDVDETMIAELFEMFDLVAVTVMVQPKCHPIPSDGERNDELLYVDEVDLQDKQFLFQWAVGGTSDVEKFREQSAEFMASLQPSEEVQSPAVLPPPTAE